MEKQVIQNIIQGCLVKHNFGVTSSYNRAEAIVNTLDEVIQEDPALLANLLKRTGEALIQASKVIEIPIERPNTNVEILM